MKNYILGLDLSTTNSGYCLMEMKSKKIISMKQLKVPSNIKEIGQKLEWTFSQLPSINKEETIIYCEKSTAYGFERVIYTSAFIYGFMTARFGDDNMVGISPHSWRQIIYNKSNPNSLGRTELKLLAVHYCNRLYGLQLKNSENDLAEAILIARYGSIMEGTR